MRRILTFSLSLSIAACASPDVDVDVERPAGPVEQASFGLCSAGGDLDFQAAPDYDAFDGFHDVAVASGKIFALASYSSTYSGSASTNVLARFLGDGTEDVAFGSGPHHTVTIPSGLYRIGVQPSGGLILAGQTENGGQLDFIVSRYSASGQLDTSFGFMGSTETDFGQLDDEGVADLAIQADGKIVAVGSSDSPVTSGSRFAVTRYNAGGGVDAVFGTRLFDFGPTSQLNYPTRVALQPDGKIVVVGMTVDEYGLGDVAVLRLKDDGSADPSFGDDGRVIVDMGTDSESAAAVAIQSDGKIVVGGAITYPGSSEAFVIRLDTLGGRDMTFGTSGTAFVPSASGIAEINVLSDDTIVMGASFDVTYIAVNDYRIGVARSDPDGALDPSFSGDGVAYTSSGLGPHSAWGMATLPDGRVVVVGQHQNEDYSEFDAVMAAFCP